MRPRIGITTSTITRDGNTATSVNFSYSHVIYAAGGMPIPLPTLPGADVDEILSSLDALLLSGGGDVNPQHWGEAPHEKLGVVDDDRDAFEMALFHTALARDLPVLGICRGSQVMAVAAGGSLWQDLPSQYHSAINHHQPDARHIPTHTVEVTAGSLLARILQPDAGESGAPLTLHVNSFHHQAAKSYGTLLSAIAASTDGLPEALVAPGATFVLGVQWHPEEMAETDPLQARLFSALIDAACGVTP